jgi:hypothetical protein
MRRLSKQKRRAVAGFGIWVLDFGICLWLWIWFLGFVWDFGLVRRSFGEGGFGVWDFEIRASGFIIGMV